MSQLNAGDVFAGRYKVLEYSGEGSLGSTYVCEDIEAENSNVVVKLISPKFSSAPGFTNSYVMFTKSAMQINQPGIVKVKDVNSFSDVWYTVTEYIEGKNLKNWLQNALSFEERVLSGLELLKKLGRALPGLHEVGHYACLKPQNI